jgi:NitT/TauT family transport system substrate-binding protein
MEDMIKKDPDMIRSFLRARAKAVRFFYDQPDKTISIWAEELKLPEDAVRLAHKSIPRTFFEAGAPKTENLMAAMQEAIATGAMKEPLDLKQILDLRFLPPNMP